MNNVQLFVAIALPIAFNAIGFLLLRASITDLRDSLNGRIDDLAKRLDGRIDALAQRIDDLGASLNKRMDDIHRRIDDARGPVRPDAAGGRR
jgi:tetrahydromethanopterin S-methyltransferase subunit G